MTDVVNTNAAPYWGNANNVCQISGFKAKPGQLVTRWDGLLVLPKFSEPRNDQDFVRVKPERQRGSIRPEAADNFVSTAITADDL